MVGKMFEKFQCLQNFFQMKFPVIVLDSAPGPTSLGNMSSFHPFYPLFSVPLFTISSSLAALSLGKPFGCVYAAMAKQVPYIVLILGLTDPQCLLDKLISI